MTSPPDARRKLRSRRASAVRRTQALEEPRKLELRQPVHHPVGGEDDEPGVLHRGEEHRSVLDGRAGRAGLRPQLVADGQHRLVAVVPVGDVDLLLRHRRGDALVGGDVRQAPDPVHDDAQARFNGGGGGV